MNAEPKVYIVSISQKIINILKIVGLYVVAEPVRVCLNQPFRWNPEPEKRPAPAI